MILNDQIDRDRFIKDHHCNFSVIAPAGVGKTTAITKRIASIIQNKSIPLDQLVVVTYTQKAAEELSLRTFIEAQNFTDDFSFLDKIFFGTIHSFADKLLRKYGSYLGILENYEIETNPEGLWQKFLSETTQLETLRQEEKLLKPFLNLDSLRELAMSCFSEEVVSENFDPKIYHFDISDFLSYDAKKNNAIKQFQKNLLIWDQNRHYPFPYPETQAREFSEYFDVKMNIVMKNLSNLASLYIQKLSHIYENYRINSQRLTFNDLIHFSTKLLSISSIANEIKGKYVILDEAQDTDKEQFQLLMGVAKNTESEYIPGGKFCMVGDAQQSIYSGRADVNAYLNLHKKLCNSGELEVLKFSVTMRFGQNIAQTVNEIFGDVLDGQNQQVEFQSISSGKTYPVDNWSVLNFTETDNESQKLALFFQNKSPAHFRVEHWSDIAILCARKEGLREIQAAFNSCSDVPAVQNHSTSQQWGNFSSFALVTAFIKFLAEPDNEFELYGILSQYYHLSSDQLSQYFVKNQKNPKILEILSALDTFRQKYALQSPLTILSQLTEKFPLHLTYSERLTLIEIATNSIDLIHFAENLYSKFHEEVSGETVNNEAIQLCTFHKSKGLEWKVVIIPFINRAMYEPVGKCPKIVNQRVAINRKQADEFDPNPLAKAQNFERLLYVAFTRQKYQTIFVCDGTSPGKNSIASTLERGHFVKKISQLHPFEYQKFSAVSQPSGPVHLPKTDSILKTIDIINKQQKLENLSIINPSLEESVEGYNNSNSIEEKIQYDAVAYGNWWHKTMEQCNFRDKNAQHFLLESAAQSPVPECAKLEIQKLIQCKEFWKKIQQSDKLYKEYSFCVKKDNFTVIDGRIDLLLSSENQLTIIDFKTNKIDNFQEINSLARNQLNLYREALRKAFNRNSNLQIKCYIYSSKLGQLIPIN